MFWYWTFGDKIPICFCLAYAWIEWFMETTNYLILMGEGWKACINGWQILRRFQNECRYQLSLRNQRYKPMIFFGFVRSLNVTHLWKAMTASNLPTRIITAFSNPGPLQPLRNTRHGPGRCSWTTVAGIRSVSVTKSLGYPKRIPNGKLGLMRFNAIFLGGWCIYRWHLWYRYWTYIPYPPKMMARGKERFGLGSPTKNVMSSLWWLSSWVGVIDPSDTMMLLTNKYPKKWEKDKTKLAKHQASRVFS